MKLIRAAALTLAASAYLTLNPPSHAEGHFHFPVGLYYSQGALDAQDAILDAYEADWGANVDTRIEIPVGLNLSPYYEWDSGLGVGLSFGPTTFIVATLDSSISGTDTKFSFIIPVGADVRYTLFNKKKVAPYAKVGFRYPIAGGDDIESSTPGVYGGVGVEFWRNKAVGLSIEVGYDSSKVEIKPDGPLPSKNVTFAGFCAGVCAVF